MATNLMSAEAPTIDLTEPQMPTTGHRLTELIQALTGCSVERAELALGDPIPSGPADPEWALASVSAAMVRLRARQPA
jgi:hypothetical protein